MKNKTVITLFTVLFVITSAYCVKWLFLGSNVKEHIKVGFIYNGDAGTSYTNNFIQAEEDIRKQFGDSVEFSTRYNVSESEAERQLQELANEKCDIIFATSYGYGEKTKEMAGKYPDIQFCQATCSNANDDPYYSNYHNYMGAVYQGRYVAGVVAGMKIKELIDKGDITKEQAKAGYVAAYPYAEVISGYTAFFLGVRSVVPEAVMSVKYTNSWNNYSLEKKYAKELIEDGCVVISQHSDTAGPAMACEQMRPYYQVYHVGYNQSMTDIAPSTSLFSFRINWGHYETAAVKAVMSGKKIEDLADGNINGNDAWAGFDKDWIQTLDINEIIAADGTKEKVDEVIHQFENDDFNVFQGDYIGVNPYDETDVIDLKKGYIENEKTSAPTFNYVLKDVITVN